MKDKAPGKSQNLFISLSIIISLTFSVLFAEWVLRYQRQSIDQKIKHSEQMDPGMILYDAQLGWRLKPYWSGKHHHHDYDVVYNINSNGFRGADVSVDTEEYAVVGDSFSFGLGVKDDETFTALLNADGDQKNHFYNYSVPGYSTDQQLLLVNKLRDEISKKIILVVYLGNDIFDNMRDYPLQAEHGKPYFKLNNNNLQLKNTPVPHAAKSAAAQKESISSIVLGKENRGDVFSNWLAQLEISHRTGFFQKKTVLTDEVMESRFSGSLNLFIALVHKIEKLAEKNEGQLIVLLLPGRSYVEQPASLSAQYQEYFRKHIKASLDPSSSIKVMDMAMHLRELHAKGVRYLYYPNEGHLTPSGHRYVADYLEESL